MRIAKWCCFWFYSYMTYFYVIVPWLLLLRRFYSKLGNQLRNLS